MSSGLANLALDVGRATSDAVRKPADIIEFIESSWGLNFKLFPVQRVILKAHYGIPLDDNEHRVPLDRPVPRNHPNYNELIDKPPVPAEIGIEIQAGGLIPDGADIIITEPDGSEVVLREGVDWSTDGDRREILVSIANALTGIGYQSQVRLGERCVMITSREVGPGANKATLTLTQSHGFRIAMPALDIDQQDYNPQHFNFYGGGGGFYKYRIVFSDWRRENYQYMTEAGYLRYLYDDGRCNIDRVIEGQQRREMVLSIGRRSGKCVLGDTLVLTGRGVRRIEELGDPEGPEYQPLEIGVAQEGNRARSTSAFFYNGGVKPVFKLRTRCGFKLGGTGDHRIKVMTPEGRVEWSYLSDIREGDQVAIHRGTELWAPQKVDLRPHHNTQGYKQFEFPDVLDERLGLLLGLLVGDGNWKNTQSVAFTADDPETRACGEELLTEFFGGCSFTPDKRRKRTGAVRVHGTGARQFLHDLGWVYDSDRRSKMVPWSIMQSPAPVVCSFLRGLFETDGGMEAKGKVVAFSSASERLAHEVQILLLNLGIVSRVRAKWNKTYKRDYYVLTVRGLRHRQMFAERVGFVSRRKMNPLWAGLKSAGREGGDSESIPHIRGWGTRLLTSVKVNKPGEGWSRSDLRAALGNTIKPSSKEQMTYPRLEKTLEEARRLGADPDVVAPLQALFDLDYFYDPVVAVEQGEEPVYDLNVPDGSMFVANGMTNHNTTISACIAAYETYKLLLLGDPQGYYGLTPSSVIQIVSVATDKDQAGLLYREVSGHYKSSDYFVPYTANHTLTYANFQTPNDIDRYGSYRDNPKVPSSIKVTFKSCVAKGLRGAGNMIVILDEFAHFTDGSQSSAEAVYNAVTPSTSTFSRKDPRDKTIPVGEVEGRIISISSPLGKQGQFYKLYRIGFGAGAAAGNMLCIQAPTWEVNPTLPAHEFAKHFAKDARVFYTEYGGEFTDKTLGWIEKDSDLYACIDPKARPRMRRRRPVPHYGGFDLGLVNDGSAIAIGHLENNRVVVDIVDQIVAGEGEFEGCERLKVEWVADWVSDWCKRFPIASGIFDQWHGLSFEDSLAQLGLKQWKAQQFTKTLNSQVYDRFKDLMLNERIDLYDYPIPEGEEHCPYIVELTELQAKIQSKHIIVVEAPKVEGKHDDMSDAIVRMVWEASQHLVKSGHLATGRGRRRKIPNAPQKPSAGKWRRVRQDAKLGGSHPSRQVPKKGRNGRHSRRGRVLLTKNKKS